MPDIEELLIFYNQYKSEIQSRIKDFTKVPKEKYFYELVYCLCTPMSKATNATKVQSIFEEINFLQNPINPEEILSNPENYIRFHNQKSKYIIEAQTNYHKIQTIISSDEDNFAKREKLVKNVKGIGYKEASHFLRNIGIFGLAILDRHILRNLAKYQQFDLNSSISSKKQYEKVEKSFFNFSKLCNLEVEELDLLLWFKETGKILK
jgi:N-glycosylase/DNA lyase